MRSRIEPLWIAAAAAALLAACGGAQKAREGDRPGVLSVQRGKASWYGGRFHGKRTASGERFNQNELTAAHRTLPFGSVVRVTNRRNGRQVKVRINDRGPFGRRGRIIDLSRAAARRLGFLGRGVAPVRVEVLSRPDR